jgi:hypothetical protein
MGLDDSPVPNPEGPVPNPERNPEEGSPVLDRETSLATECQSADGHVSWIVSTGMGP